MQWLPHLYDQHKDFPGLEKWIFVESADVEYAKSNPNLVNGRGLSVDGTSAFLQELERVDKRVQYVPFGFSEHKDKAQGKCPARNAYLEILDNYSIDYLLLLDGDEFWLKKHQNILSDYVSFFQEYDAFLFPHREVWYPPYLQGEENKKPLFSYEVRGGFWAIVISRVWKYHRGMRYIGNHNTPSFNGTPLNNFQDYRRLVNSKLKILREGQPEMIHLGFASYPQMRAAKNRYYEDRGESLDPKRRHYTISRQLWETWTPKTILPKAAVVPYSGEIPEVFLENML